MRSIKGLGLVVGSLLFTASSLFAVVTLPGFLYPDYIGPVRLESADGSGGLDQTIWTDSTIYSNSQSNVTNPSPATADALVSFGPPVNPRSNGTFLEDSWGVGMITGIFVAGPNNKGLPNGTPLWLPGSTNEVTFTFFGILDEKVQVDSSGNGHIASEGMLPSVIYPPGGTWVDFWYHTPAFATAVTNGPLGRSGAPGSNLTAANLQYPGITTGTHWLSIELRTGADSFATSNTVLRDDFSGVSPFSGTDLGFADVASNGLFGAGADNLSFVNHSKTTDLTGILRDFSFQVPLFGTGTNMTAVPFGWTTHNLNATATLLSLIGCISNTVPTFLIQPQSAMVVNVVVQNAISGLQAINVLLSQNANIVIPPFTAGTTSPVTVVATKLNGGLKAVIGLQAVDICNGTAVLDPIVTTLTVALKSSVEQTFEAVPPDEHFVSIKNGPIPLTMLLVKVNRKTYSVLGLKPGEIRVLDVAGGMYYADNTVTLTGFGRRGASATVLIGDSSATNSKTAVAKAAAVQPKAASGFVGGWGKLSAETQR